MSMIRVFTPTGVYDEFCHDPQVRAKDVFDDFECPECGYTGDVVGEVRYEDGTLVGAIECPECDYEEEY